MGAILSLFAGPSGKTSSMRVATLACVATIMGTWCTVSLRKLELQPLSPEQVVIVLGALGIKAAQRATEQKAKTPGEPGA